MSSNDWILVLAGIAAIVWVNWYFFFATRPAATAALAEGRQEIEIVVRGGYDPGIVRVKRGVPVRLVFNRQDTSSCSEEVVLTDFGIKRFLPAGERTPVDLTPDKTGQFEITCGMSMLHGKLVVES
ncbi:MAG TPA: cupredoxin domain-containing protein [Gemmatimonadaceae bacterium]|nr:cupredoxin domain-containing protein [Gemmatimonadaceae bacterium]